MAKIPIDDQIGCVSLLLVHARESGVVSDDTNDAAEAAITTLKWLRDNRRGVEAGVKIMADDRVRNLTSQAEDAFGGYEISAVRSVRSDVLEGGQDDDGE